MGSRMDIFIVENGKLGLYYSHWGANSAISVACNIVENGNEYENSENPMADCFAEAAILIDPGQKKAWIYSDDITSEWQYHISKGSNELRCDDRVRRLWTFILQKTYRDIYTILKNCNLWRWPEPKWNELENHQGDNASQEMR